MHWETPRGQLQTLEKRLHGYLGDVPPSEFEVAYAAQQTDQQLVGIQ